MSLFKIGDRVIHNELFKKSFRKFKMKSNILNYNRTGTIIRFSYNGIPIVRWDDCPKSPKPISEIYLQIKPMSMYITITISKNLDSIKIQHTSEGFTEQELKKAIGHYLDAMDVGMIEVPEFGYDDYEIALDEKNLK